MKKNYKVALGTLALGVVVFTGSYMGVQAYQGDNTQKGSNFSQERRAEMNKIFADNDYEAWKAQLQNRGRWTQEMQTRENFEKMQQVHQKMLAGDYEGARELRAELGLGGGRGMGQGNGMGRHNGENRGQNNGGNFVDADGDGVCDNLN